jgi:hypothetical protein
LLNAEDCECFFASIREPDRGFVVNYRFAIFLTCTGLAATAVMMMPGLIVLGLLLGILPGIALALSPGVFVYSALWWGARTLILQTAAPAGDAARNESRSRMTARVAGVGAAILIAVPALIIPRAINFSLDNTAQELRSHDSEQLRPVALAPVTALVMHENRRWRKALFCGTICQRLLYNGTVSRLIVADPRKPELTTAFWIERRESCPAVLMDYDVVFPGDFQFGRGDSPRERVLARIAGGECLIAASGSLHEADVTISFGEIRRGESAFSHPWSLILDTVSATRLEIASANGHVLYRRTEVTAEPLVLPLNIGVGAGLMTTVTYAGWARSKETTASMGPVARDVLADVLGPAIRPPDRHPLQ